MQNQGADASKSLCVSVSLLFTYYVEETFPYNMQVTHSFLENVADSSGATHVPSLIG